MDFTFTCDFIKKIRYDQYNIYQRPDKTWAANILSRGRDSEGTAVFADTFKLVKLLADKQVIVNCLEDVNALYDEYDEASDNGDQPAFFRCYTMGYIIETLEKQLEAQERKINKYYEKINKREE